MMHTVRLTGAARRDLYQIYDYIFDHDAPENAEYVLSRIEAQFLSLGELPSRGTIVPEMAASGDSSFREVFFKPYRIIYEVLADEVIVHAIVDGRRSIYEILSDRLTR